MSQNSIYFDHNATTNMYREAIDTFNLYANEPLNASSIHTFGIKGKKILESSRHLISNFMGLDDRYQLLFTKSATEANNIAILGLRHIYNIITTPIEHPSILNIVGEGIVPVDNSGIVNLEVLESILYSTKTKLMLSIAIANSETGVIQNTREICQLCHKYGALLHLDGAQAFGKIEYNTSDIDADIVTLSGHKMGAGFGAAVLAFKKDIPIMPLTLGGPQESRIIPGTHNVPAIAALASVADKKFVTRFGKIKTLRDYMEKKLLDFKSDIVIFGAKADRLPNTSSISMMDKDSQTQVIHFDLNNIMISAGSACASGKVDIPRVQMSMGYTEKIAKSAVRISMGISNTKTEVDVFLDSWQNFYNNSN